MAVTVKPRGGFGSRRRLYVAGAVILAALVFIVVQGLGNATVYFKTADEAVRDRAALGTHRFRIEGTVVPDSVKVEPSDAVAFSITSNGVTVPVLHEGNEPALFSQASTPPPVVLEGHFDGTTFESDRIIVKHTATYTEQHPDRVTTTTIVPS